MIASSILHRRAVAAARVTCLAGLLGVLLVANPLAAAEPAAGQHDMLLLLPTGPIHVRAWITDGGQPLQQVRQNYIQQLVTSLDTDSDGKLSRSETMKHPLFVSGRRYENNPFLDSLRSKRPYTDREIELAVDRVAGQPVAFRQNNTFAEQDLSVFRVLDQNESGLIDRAEMRLAPAQIAERDSDFDQCITFNEFLQDSPDVPADVVIMSVVDTPPTSLHSELLRDASEPVLAARLVRLYDQDRDAHLSAPELGWSDQRLAALDTDHDGRLSMQELGSIAQAQPDMQMTVDLAKPQPEAMRLVSPENETQLPARIERGNVRLSISYRYRDPVEEARRNAENAFNLIDVDANGYLDRDEIAEHQRFERYLFDAMDEDDDDRVFAAEMLKYVTSYAEAASTSCQATLVDTGNGFFQMLDANDDGRISIRELRECEQRLVGVAGEDNTINPSRLAKSFRIEFERGGVSLFGRVDRPDAQSPAVPLRNQAGPIWFQRMDRNGDGDLTWDEFLGPREVFEQLDADQDGLLDPTEAAQAHEKTP
ncbi:hypothetical protein DTL42_18780 [Bremerella cremea]|uniref:EF-hand domain-containing protein n=1 Tax=Bremerella cremea TaxID=1031537 RepID=A0A368KPQ7_9BACT|nr:EF-hand domain-containing protein [Bremerella cremea]RCS43543.1 hypothetical protein DTL42_18780 [Bremerella cremea]